ncbi:hypothetical protein [Hankyongella ginsenosidimutans]|uniref:hypothetical protein n=1 Tax=Hankyongella ginsenosidimutans TaxID=1763828 RepID=UPI001CA36F53|nr:hypothetical protein [Hankyongella ginsenosidimutans]
MNNLQGLDPRQDIFVSLNPQIAIAPDKMFQTLEFRHPVFDLAAIRAQRRLETIQEPTGCGSAAPGPVMAFMRTVAPPAW